MDKQCGTNDIRSFYKLIHIIYLPINKKKLPICNYCNQYAYISLLISYTPMYSLHAAECCRLSTAFMMGSVLRNCWVWHLPPICLPAAVFAGRYKLISFKICSDFIKTFVLNCFALIANATYVNQNETYTLQSKISSALSVSLVSHTVSHT